ncbi:hypothetical protein [Cohnella abietis]|uniref:Uncharacterized protein n=1 Tax=Cohnella abietis TaxID=2507935 RepID=A0A3T1D396_9BACL|nr:hypothetical protein [Cohnella abietis]BBI32499.1 hypothetical protein KCTCHS21_18980 [Cohnella abietis]
MSDPETQKLNEIAVQVARVEVGQEATSRAVSDMAANVNKLVDKLEKSDVLARRAEDRASSAHHRIDEERKRLDDTNRHYDNEIKSLNARIDTENRERKLDKRWMIGTTLSAAGLIIAVIKLF